MDGEEVDKDPLCFVRLTPKNKGGDFCMDNMFTVKFVKDLYKKQEAERKRLHEASRQKKPLIETVYIFRNFIRCEKDKHKIQDVAAKVKRVYFDGTIKIRASYCSDCNKYFIGEESLNEYIEQYGELDVEIINDFMGNSLIESEYDNFNLQSKLHKLGYNVSTLSSSQRKERLVRIIENELIDRHDIISLIEMFIRMNKNRHDRVQAVKKWCDDLVFLNDYEINRLREIYAKIVRDTTC